ncbi:MAG: HepT-like ribonuclease domain-containing protein [Euryarchaeota archaeon]|nr:HepT-like ribonuclease domain-containing protein [Euryarchaeota archaeon]
MRKKYPEVPWKDMAGMRDRLIHAYFGVDYTLVWEAIKTKIPEITPILRRVVAEMKNE